MNDRHIYISNQRGWKMIVFVIFIWFFFLLFSASTDRAKDLEMRHVNSRHRPPPWSEHTTDVGPRPRREDTRLRGCRGWLRRPIYPQACRKVPFLAPRGRDIRAFQRTRTMLAVPLGLLLLNRNPLILRPRLLLLTLAASFLAEK